MGLKIENFTENKLEVADYDLLPAKRVGLNKKTAKQLAAQEAISSGGQMDDYENIKAELLDPEQRAKFLLRHENTRRGIFNDARDSVIDFVADGSLDDETKMQLVQGANNGFNTGMPPATMDTLAKEAYAADSGAHETGRSMEGRNLMLEQVEATNAHKRNMANLINGLKIDPTTASTVKDVAELIAPFAEWIHFDRLLSSVKGENSTGLLGQQKQELFEFIKGKPLEERARLAESLIEIVKNSDNVVLPDGNDLVTLEALENMLIDNDYSDFERYFDNITSVLDIIGVGALARTTLKGSRGAKVVSEANRTKLTMSEVHANNMAEQAELEALMKPEFEPLIPTSKIDGLSEGNTDTSPMMEAFRKAKTHAVRTDVNPASPSQIVKDVNPEAARDMHKMASDDETGEAAEALYGTSREEALAKDILPEPGDATGSVPNKVEMRRPSGEMDSDLEKAYRRNGNIIMSESELSKIRTKISAGLDEVEGMVLHPASLTVRTNLDESVTYTARYSPLDSGFSSPQEAIEHAEVAFRNYGLTQDDFTILARNGDSWDEVVLKDENAKIALQKAGADLSKSDYAIGMKYDYKFSPEDIDLIADEIDMLTTAPSIVARGLQYLDRGTNHFFARAGQGSILQNVLDSAASIHPQIIGGASVAVDRVQHTKKLFVDTFEEFTNVYGGLSKERRALMTDYINEANLEGIPLSITDLRARGFNTKEIEALKTWRRANDAMWHAANEDMVRTLKAKGVKAFTHKDKDTLLMGRPQSHAAAKPGTVYDPVLDTNRQISAEELDELYSQGGELMKLTQTKEIDGQVIDTIVSFNTPDGGFIRRIREGEKVLSYRDGYYPVMYDANFFVYKTAKNADGTTSQKVFASAQSRKEVDTILEGIRQADGLSDEDMLKDYGYRKDRREESPDNSLFDEGSWNVSANSGLSSQKFRGERLEDGGTDLHKMGKGQLKDPLEAISQQIQTLSQRVSMRTYMDTAKKRWMAQYEQYLDLKIDPNTGKVGMPKNVGEVKGKPGVSSKMVEDARANYNYLSALENGYTNGIDATYRGAMHVVADLFGELGISSVEKAAFSAAKTSPANAAKTTAFKLFLSSNPARQALIQRGQMLMLGVHNPKYALTELMPDMVGIERARLGLKTDPKYVKLLKEVQKSGVLEAVEAHELIRTDKMRLADLTWAQKAGSTLSKPLDVLQKYGFSLAEQDVLVSAYLSARNKAKIAGKNLKSQRVKDEILAETRSFTLAMNRAGEMPYSQNTFGIATQFLSFQHKAVLQGLTNRSLSRAQRAKLLGYSFAMFGAQATVPTAIVYNLLPDQPNEVKDAIADGMLDVALNQTLTALSGQQQAIDFGDFAPSEAYGFGDTFFSLLQSDISQMVVESPAGSLLFGANPRLNDMMKTGFKFFYPPANYEEEALAVDFVDVVHTSMNMFSGYSNIFKANYAYHTGQKMSSSGKITDADVTAIESVATLFGFRTKTEEGSRLAMEIEYGDSAYTADDVDKFYTDLKRHLARRFESTREQDLADAAIREAWRVFGHDREHVMSTIARRIQNDAKNQDYKLFERILRRMGHKSESDTWKMINALPAGNARDELAKQMNLRKEMNDGG